MALQLISSADVRSIIKNIPATISSDKIDVFIVEAQEMDIAKVLGAELLQDLLDEIDVSPELPTTTLSNLYNGLTWTDGDTKYKFEGLKKVMCYASAYRLMREQAFNPTAFGLVVKVSEFSEPLSDAQITSYVAIQKEKYLYYIKELESFLCAKYDDYPQRKGNKEKKRIRFKSIGE